MVPGGGGNENATSVTITCGRHRDFGVQTRNRVCAQNIRLENLEEDLDRKVLLLKKWVVIGYAIEDEAQVPGLDRPSSKAQHQAIRARNLQAPLQDFELSRLPIGSEPGPQHFTVRELACLRA